jgi:hypothetical protein
MLPLSRISGRVVDDRGEGVASAEVELIGSGRLLEESTDDTGKFELRLLPDAYTLSVTPPRGLRPPNPRPDNDGVMVWTRTFFPGSLQEAASKIVAQPGEMVFIELKLQSVPVHAVRGVLLNPDGTSAPNVSITLSEEAGQPLYRAESQSGGIFEFPAVVDGEWRLAAAVENDGLKLRAMRWIEMAGRELEGVRLRLSPPFTVRGQMVMETPNGMPAPNPPPVYLVPRGERSGWESWMSNWMQRPEMHFVDPLPASAPGSDTTKHAQAEVLDSFQFLGAVSVRPDAGGNFRFPNVYPGNYQIVPMPPPPLPYYLDAVRVGETELSGQEIDLSSEVPVTVVYKANGGAVRGTVEKCASGPVLLVPQEATKQRIGFLHSAKCDSNDRYGITGVRPGEYYAFAFAGDGPLPELTEDLLKQASKVTVRAGEASLADLRAISREY